LQLSKEITREYLSRFLLFKNCQEIADMIGVSRLTVHRWKDGLGSPRSSLLPDFDVAFDRLLDWIEDQGFPSVAEALDFDRPAPEGRPMMRASRVEGWLVDRLTDKKPSQCTYSKIEKDAKKAGITRAQLYRTSVKLGVVKELTGFGINRASRWSLP